MQAFFFWKEWPRPFKELYYFLFITFCAAVIWMVYAYLQGNAITLDWNTLGDTQKTDTLINSFKVGPFTLSVSAESTIFYQRFEGSFPRLNILSYYIFLAVTVVSANILLTIATTLSRFWYYVGIALFAAFLVNLKLELLMLFGSDWKSGLTIALLLFLPCSYFFNVIKPNISFVKRLGVFMLLTLVMGLIIYFFSEVKSPFLYLSASGIINPLIISMIFILLVANEIISWMIYIITHANTATSKNTLPHFLVLIVIYMTNLVLAYFHEARQIDWDLIYVNLFFLLLTSTLLGIWGYKNREEQYGYLFKFYPFGAIFYIVMAITCIVTIAHFITTGNDVALEVFRDTIIYGHIGFGTIFILYILGNFAAPLKSNLKVYKVLYKPTGMPYFTFRFAGIIAVAAFFLYANWKVTVKQATAGYYNSLGDLHLHDNDVLLAQQYFKEASEYGYNNHKANYTLGHLNARQKNIDEAIKNYEDATKKWPSVQSFVNLANLRKEEKGFFEGLFTLQEGSKVYPNTGPIQNNIGLLYSKTDILDTTFIYLDKAYQNESKKVAGSNILAMVAKKNLDIKADSVLADYEIANDPISINNRFVLSNNSAESADLAYSPSDSTLSFIEASIFYNGALNALFKEDSINTEEIYHYADIASNVNFRESLQYIASLNHYKNNNVNKAFRRLNWLANRLGDNSGKYFNHVGLWALEQNAPDVAVDYFKWSLDEGFEEARLNLAIALTESQNNNVAIAVWQDLRKKDDNNLKQMSNNLLSILTLKETDLATLSDNQKHLFLRYNLTANDTILFDRILNQISNTQYRADAILNMAEKLWSMDRSEAAIRYYTQLAELPIEDRNLFEKIQWFELKLLAARGNVRGLAQKINQGVEFTNQRAIEKAHYTGLLNEASGDTTQALANYEYINFNNPFKAEAVIAAANFIGKKDRFKAYDILIGALEINPRSVRLLKAYILQCARIQSESYAEIAFETLGQIITNQELTNFRKQYNELVQEVERAEEAF